MSLASLTRWIVSSEISPTHRKYLAAHWGAREISYIMKWYFLGLICIASLLPLQAAEKSMSTGAVVVLPLKGAVSEAQFFFLRRALKNAEAVAAAAVVLDMDTPGGDLKATEKIVQMFSGSPIPAYTYVNANAGSAGALIALGTKNIFMAPVSAIGAAAPVAGSGQEISETMNAKIVSYYSGYFRSVAQKNGYYPELVDGFMNLDKEVKIGDEVINPKGALLTLSAQEAIRDIGGKPLLATGIAPDLASMVTACGLSVDRITRIEPSGFESVAQWITMLAPLFLLGGIMGAYLEFKAPGFGVAGVLSGVCFLLFFGGHYIAGLTGLEMVALFFMGALCILIEFVFFPGVFFLALGGVLMVIAAVFFSMADLYPAQPFQLSFEMLRTPMLNMMLTVVASVVGIGLLARFLPSIPLFRGLFLSSSSPAGPSIAPIVTELGAAARVGVGETGKALSILRPSGRAEIGDCVFDVLTNGEFLEAGTKIQVLAVNGQNIIVGREVV
jgi:membrane-bound serine protease (ClpP class)